MDQDVSTCPILNGGDNCPLESIFDEETSAMELDHTGHHQSWTMPRIYALRLALDALDGVRLALLWHRCLPSASWWRGHY